MSEAGTVLSGQEDTRLWSQIALEHESWLWLALLCGHELGHSGGFIPMGSEFPYQPQQGLGVELLRLHSQATPETIRETWRPDVL